MIGKIIKYSAVIGATITATIATQNCYNKTMYKGTPAADGRPSFERVENLEITFKDNNGFLETYVKDATQNRTDLIPVYQREDKLLIGDIQQEFPLMTSAEKQFCFGTYSQELNQQKEQQTGMKGNEVGRWLGDKIKKGEGMMEQLIDGIMEEYHK